VRPRSKEELRAILDAHAGKPATPRALVLGGDEHDHDLDHGKERVVCRRCGAGYLAGTPGLLPTECDEVAHTRRKLGLS
jgi:hypothetical protein